MNPFVNRLMLTGLVAILMAVILIMSIAAFPTTVTGQQRDIQVGDLAATLNGDNFTAGDIITINGTIHDPDTESVVTIKVIDPESKIVMLGEPEINANGTFAFSFAAGDEEIFDGDESVVGNSTYRMVVTYTENNDDFDINNVEFLFGYAATSTISLTLGPEEQRIESGQMDTTGSTLGLGRLPLSLTTIFQSNIDGIRIGVPDGWVVEDLNNTDPMLSQYEQSYGGISLIELCPQNQATPQIGRSYLCPEHEEGLDSISIWRFEDLRSRPEFKDVLRPNQNINTTDLVAFYFQFLEQKANYTKFRLLENIDTTVDVIDPQTNQTIETAPAKYIETTFQYSSGNRSRPFFTLLVLLNDGNTGFALLPLTSVSTAAGELPPEHQLAINSFKLIVLNNTANTMTSTSSYLTQGQQETLQVPLTEPKQQRPPQIPRVLIISGSSTMTNNTYRPSPLEVSAGDKVTWINDDSQVHTVTSGKNTTRDGNFDSGMLAPLATFEYTFAEAGEYPYFCLLHPNMIGTVIVVSRPPIFDSPTLPNID